MKARDDLFMTTEAIAFIVALSICLIVFSVSYFYMKMKKKKIERDRRYYEKTFKIEVSY